MLTVSSLKNFDFFNNFELIAGSSGLSRNVANVVILDFEGVEENYFGFQSGDFVITNLLFAKDNPERIYNSFQALIKLGVSAFAIKTVFYTKLPQNVIDLANENEIPIFSFKDIFIEDVIINITDYLRSSTNYTYYEHLIDKFISEVSNTDEIQQFLNALEIQFQSQFVSSIYLTPKGHVNEFALQRLISQTQLTLNSLSTENPVSVVKYKHGLIFLTFFRDKHSVHCDLKKYWRSLLRSISIDINQYISGINDSVLPASHLDIVIRRSLYAYRASLEQNVEFETYSNLGVTNIVWPVLEDSYTSAHILELIHKISPDCSSIKDFQNDPIYPTIHSYVINNFDIISTANDLFTHQNTIRYRIKKLKENLNIEDETFFRFFLYTIFYSSF